MKTRQTELWSGKFGDEYIKRNDFAEWKMDQGVEAFNRILNGLEIESVLEVGSNIGMNLHFLQKIYTAKIKLYAVEPNEKAYKTLLNKEHGLKVEKAWRCDSFNLPLEDSSVDLAFTKGVLMHIAPENLSKSTDELVRVAKRYVLCIEYFSHKPEEILYHGQKSLLFKRDFGAFYQDRYPQLKCINYGFLWQREFSIFDDLNWWLFEKQER